MADPNWVREYQDGEIVPGTPYRVVSLLGAGGMGSVYEVEHIELGRRYVLKSLLRTLASRQDLIARMRNEWRSLGKLQHPNIVDILNAGVTTADVPYYVMERLEGETVRDRLQREGKLPVDEAARIARGTLFGLAAAHAIGIVHRDVKPANVFLTRDGAVKVLDFGVAQVTRSEGDQKITAQGLAIGTPRYMSPEQASGDTADARSDLYATGLLLFEMLAGEGPFDDLGDTSQQMLAHLHRPARPLSRLTEVPAEIESIVKRALAKRPQDRPRSAEVMAADLAPFAASTAKSANGVPLTPSGVVLNSSPMFANLGLGTEWERPTVEISTARRKGGTSPTQQKVPHRSLVSGHALGAAVVAGLTVGIAVLAFGAANRPAAPLTASGTMQPGEQGPALVEAASVAAAASRAQVGAEPGGSVLAETSPAPSIIGNPALALAPNVTENLKLRAVKDTKKAKKPRTAHPSGDADAVRLPPSGL